MGAPGHRRGEYGLALEDMAGILAHAGAPVTGQERAAMLALARTMEIDDLVPHILQCRPPDGQASIPGDGDTARN